MTKKKVYQKALAILLVFSMLFSLIVVANAENDGEFQIKIVHTNDIHARVQENADSGIIGMEKLGGIIDSYTADADMDLVLDSGDLFHGQPIATLVQGESVAQLAKACGYDAMTAGNHDWSYGKDRLKALCGIADVNMLTGNVVEDTTGNKFFDNEFYTETVMLGGKELKVGIFGVIDPKIKKSTTPSNVEGLTFADPVAYSKKAAAELREQDCDIVIALTHTYAPVELAGQVSGVDLWLAGHEHMQIDEEVTAADGKTTRVIESGYYLYSLSLIEISGTLDDNGDAENLSIEVTPMTYADTSEYESKESVTTVMNEITAAQSEKLNEKVGSTPVNLDGVWEDLRIYQQNLGNVVTDAYLLETDADVAFENAGGIRASIAAGDVTYGNIIGVSPYGNYVVTKDITGAELKEIMETSLEIQSQCIAAKDSGDNDAWPQSSGSYLQFGGMTVTYDPDKEAGNRVLSIKVQGEPLDEEELYTVATNNYVAVSSYYSQLANAEETGQFTACDEILVRFFKQSDEEIAKSINSERLFNQAAENTTAADKPNETLSNIFVDVPENAWYYNSVKYVFENGLMSGISETEFAPEMDITRAMFVTVLYRAAGAPDMSEEIWGYPFEDVDAESWYGAAVYWARNNDIVQGYSDEKFAPDELVTREQIAAIMQRYAQFKGIDTDEIGDLAQFTDAEKISDWAQNNVVWAVGKGLLTGKGNGVLDPLGNATRAEVAAMLQRFNESSIVSHESELIKTADLDKVVPIDEEKTAEITAALYDYFTTADAETGNPYVFEIVGEFDADNEHYYLGRWQWNVEGHNSLLCDFVLKESLTEMYDCTIEDNKIDWFEGDSVIK